MFCIFLIKKLINENEKLEASKYIHSRSVDENLKLHPHQVEGVEWLLSIVHDYKDSCCPGGILADEMGLGKTVQIACFLERWNNERNLEIKKWMEEHPDKYTSRPQKLSILLIVPLALMKNWSDELAKWFYFYFFFIFPSL